MHGCREGLELDRLATGWPTTILPMNLGVEQDSRVTRDEFQRLQGMFLMCSFYVSRDYRFQSTEKAPTDPSPYRQGLLYSCRA